MPWENVRVLIDEARSIVDLVVHDNVNVLLAGVLRDVGEGEILAAHVCEWIETGAVR